MIQFALPANECGNGAPKKLHCARQLLRITECMNTSVLDCAVTFTCDRNVCVYGIEVKKIVTVLNLLNCEQNSPRYPPRYP